MDVERIKKLQTLGKDKLTVLPAIELRSQYGGRPIHYICIFPENCDLADVWTRFQGSLGLTPKAIQEKGGDEKIYVPIEKGVREARIHRGIVSIHAGAKSNSIEEISNREQFQQRIKYDITKHHVDLMEIGQIKDIDIHMNTIFPKTGLNKPLILCSDNHKATEYFVKAPLWLRAEPTILGLQMVMREPRDRVFIGHRPPDVIRVEQNKTKYIHGITFKRKADTPNGEQWFSGFVPFSHGLVAIIGNKGSGKSALADTLGLLGATKNAEAFSFLSKQRFRHPTGNLAEFFDATIEWESGETATKCLADSIQPDEVERLKYLPQDHFETICNEIAGIGKEGFEQELKAVIFSHVPDVKRLGHSTLDELIRFQTDEKQKHIDSLLMQLREATRLRTTLEAQGDPIAKSELNEKIKRKQLELEAHEKVIPAEIQNPSANTGAQTPNATLLQDLSEAEQNKKTLNDQINTTNETLRAAERRHAVADKLLEKLVNFQKDFDVVKSSVDEYATELGLTTSDLISMMISVTKPTTIRDEAATTAIAAKQKIDVAEPPGLRKQLATAEAKIFELQSKLDAPNRAYQAYIKSLTVWKEKRASIVGSKEDFESLDGMKSSLSGLDELPRKIEKAKDQQVALSLQIHTEKLAQAEVYRSLYGSVQEFINSHALASDKLKLEFRVELTNEDFTGRLLSLLALNRRGSFMGVDEGRARAESLAQSTKWGDEDSIRSFLGNVNHALHVDRRDDQEPDVQLKNQLARGKNPEEVYDLLYGLEYIRPRYILRWEGKDLSMLSPGERGTLLLVFYLLVDKSDLPLVIDQPEGNLDNYTVAKVLVECIKVARNRRQVVIVTHNPNLAVVCDADQVIHANIDKTNGNKITYVTGALENPEMIKYVTDVLEGTRWAFDVRGYKYEIGGFPPK